jgi:hypothetical protein
MADTLSLDTAVQFALARGASVRLVGDNQQLAAIGSGGVLRDITHIHGALRLTELHRFTDPAEAAASLTLREGAPSGLEFYLDHGRIHVGDVATTTEAAFNAWVSDRAAGLDTIMIAPTGTSSPNSTAVPGRIISITRLQYPKCPSPTENRASVRDVIITRRNNRRLRLTVTDWVKHGDRWTITAVSNNGGLTLTHNRSHLTVRLPADYVSTSTRLGYATTRQQLYTMLSRGRAANHLYLQVVGDGDPHTVIRPDTVAPLTPTAILHQILARDEAPPQPPRSCDNSATRPPGSTTPSSATWTACIQPPSSWLAPRSLRLSTAKPTKSYPRSPASRRGTKRR